MIAFLIFFAAVMASASAFQIASYHMFMNCYDPICSLDGMYGFNCKKGVCNYICTSAGCHSDGLRDRGMLGALNTIFYGCRNPICIMNGFYGYGCNDGACQFICSNHGCYEGSRRKPQQRRGRRITGRGRRNKRKIEVAIEIQKEIEVSEGQENDSLKTTTLEPVPITTAPVPPSPTETVRVATVYTEPTNISITNSTTVKPLAMVKLFEEGEKEAEKLKKVSMAKLSEKKKQPKPPKQEKKTERAKEELAKKDNRRLKQKRIEDN